MSAYLDRPDGYAYSRQDELYYEVAQQGPWPSLALLPGSQLRR